MNEKVAIRREAAAHKRTVSMTIAQITEALNGMLGAKLTGYIANISDPKAPAEWASGARQPNEEAERRLRAAAQTVYTIQLDDSSYVARAWMIGMNPQLENETPADVLREGRLRDVALAAQAFIQGG